MRRMHHVAYKESDPCFWFKEDFRHPLVTFSSPGPTSFSRHRHDDKDRPNIKGFFLIGYERDSSKHEADYHATMLTSTA